MNHGITGPHCTPHRSSDQVPRKRRKSHTSRLTHALTRLLNQRTFHLERRRSPLALTMIVRLALRVCAWQALPVYRDVVQLVQQGFQEIGLDKPSTGSARMGHEAPEVNGSTSNTNNLPVSLTLSLQPDSPESPDKKGEELPDLRDCECVVCYRWMNEPLLCQQPMCTPCTINIRAPATRTTWCFVCRAELHTEETAYYAVHQEGPRLSPRRHCVSSVHKMIQVSRLPGPHTGYYLWMHMPPCIMPHPERSSDCVYTTREWKKHTRLQDGVISSYFHPWTFTVNILCAAA